MKPGASVNARPQRYRQGARRRGRRRWRRCRSWRRRCGRCRCGWSRCGWSRRGRSGSRGSWRGWSGSRRSWRGRSRILIGTARHHKCHGHNHQSGQPDEPVHVAPSSVIRGLTFWRTTNRSRPRRAIVSTPLWGGLLSELKVLTLSPRRRTSQQGCEQCRRTYPQCQTCDSFHELCSVFRKFSRLKLRLSPLPFLLMGSTGNSLLGGSDPPAYS